MTKLIHTLKKKKSLDGDEDILQKSNAETLDSQFQFLTVNGKRTRIKESNVNMSEKFEKQIPEMNASDEVNKRPLSDKGPIKEVVNLPKLHGSNRSKDDGENFRDLGTIRRPYDGKDGLRPLVIQAFSNKKQGQENAIDSDPKRVGNHQLEHDSEADSESARVLEERILRMKDNSISSFPPVEDEEIDKHRHMNEEAEKNSKSKAPPNRYQGYLTRLRLERKPLGDQKSKDLKLLKKKVLKRVQTKSRFARDFKEDLFDERPSTPPKPRETEAKPMKLVLGFRYSYALEQYYKGQMNYLGNEISLHSDDLENSREEVLNGWLVKSLGPNVLNLRARSMPSCNPIELRLRRRQARMRDLSRSRGLHRTWSRESGLSRALLKSRDSVSKLHTIDEGRESRHSNQSLKEKRVSISQKVEVLGIGQQSDSSTMSVLPPIYSPDKVYPEVPKLKKAISLKLPAISAEE